MESFIARMIERQAKISDEKGIEKYKAYFVNTKIYERYRENVDKILQDAGYGRCIL